MWREGKCDENGTWYKYMYTCTTWRTNTQSAHIANWRIITTVKSVFVSKLSTDVENEPRGSKLAG